MLGLENLWPFGKKKTEAAAPTPEATASTTSNLGETEQKMQAPPPPIVSATEGFMPNVPPMAPVSPVMPPATPVAEATSTASTELPKAA